MTVKKWEVAMLVVVALAVVMIAADAQAAANGYVLDLLWWIRR